MKSHHALLGLVGLFAGCGDNQVDSVEPDDIDVPGLDLPESGGSIVVGGEQDVDGTPPSIWFYESSSNLTARTPRHEARVDGRGAVTLDALASNGQVCSEPFTFSTASAALGQQVYQASPGTPFLNNQGGVIVPHAGFTEHFKNTFFGVEQSWRFPLKPVTSGDIVIRVATSGHEYTHTSRAGLHFAAVGNIGVTYSHGTWIDGNGVESHVPATIADGVITLRVPADVVATSAFPAILDPTVDLSDTFAESTPTPNSPTGANSTVPSVAAGGNEFMAVWRDNRNGGDGDIFAMRLSSAGALLTQNSLRVNNGTSTPTVGTQTNPQIAFVNGSYLVVYEDFKAANTEADLVAARITTSGTNTSVAPIGAVVATGDSEKRARIAVRGNEALVVFESNGLVRAVRYNGSTFGAAFDIGTGTQPSVAADPTGNYLVTYTVTSATISDLQGQLVTSAGALNGAAFPISAGLSAQDSSAAGFTGGVFVVVWQNTEKSLQLFGARISPAGAVLDTHLEVAATVGGVALVSSASGAAMQRSVEPGLSCSSTSCYVVWQDRRSLATLGFDVRARVITASTTVPITAGALTGPDIEVTSAADDQRNPRSTFSAALNRHFVIWQDLRDVSPEGIYGTRVDASGSVVDSAGLYIAVGNNRQLIPAVARVAGAGQNWLLAWSDSVSRGNNIVGVRVDDTLNVTGLSTTISNASGHQDAAAVAASATNYLVAWTDQRSVALGTGTGQDIFATPIGTNGAVGSSTGLGITTALKDQARPSIASSGTNYLVVWSDRQDGPFHVYGALVSTLGIVTAGPFQVTSAADTLFPTAAYDSVNGVYLVVWQDHRTDRDVFGTRIDALTGQVLDPGGFQISAAAGFQLEPRVAFGGDRFLVVWEDRRNGTADVFGARIQTSAIQATAPIVNDADGIAIATATGRQTKPTVEWISAAAGAFSVAWVDERTSASTGTDIYGISVFQADGLPVDEFPIATSTDNELGPVLGRSGPAQANGADRMLLVYQRTVASLGTERVVMRRVNFGAVTQVCTDPSICNQNCGAGESCEKNCAGTANCTTACSAATCFVNCEDSILCTTNCNSGSTCTTDCRGAQTCNATCAASGGGGTCDINCADPSTGSCTNINCNGGSRCILRCNPSDTAADCGFATCSGGATNCGGGVFACHTPCP